jgi:Low psii accumulation1 / Rep27
MAKIPPNGMSQDRYNRLVAESKAPYKGLRKFIYASAGASGAIGGFVFLTKILAGRDIAQSLPNLALQVGVVALMVFLFRWEDRNKKD